MKAAQPAPIAESTARPMGRSRPKNRGASLPTFPSGRPDSAGAFGPCCIEKVRRQHFQQFSRFRQFQENRILNGLAYPCTKVTREYNLRDLVAAYDTLASQLSVDRSVIGVVGSSYGAYLAAVLTSLRPVRWLTLRAPALYKDEDWSLPKRGLDREALAVYRRTPLASGENRALKACAAFEGDVLIVESEHDDIVPHQAVANYNAACEQAHSLTYRVISGADHALSEEPWQQAYTARLVDWVTEMVLGAREGGR